MARAKIGHEVADILSELRSREDGTSTIYVEDFGEDTFEIVQNSASSCLELVVRNLFEDTITTLDTKLRLVYPSNKLLFVQSVVGGFDSYFPNFEKYGERKGYNFWDVCIPKDSNYIYDVNGGNIIAHIYFVDIDMPVIRKLTI